MAERFELDFRNRGYRRAEKRLLATMGTKTLMPSWAKCHSSYFKCATFLDVFLNIRVLSCFAIRIYDDCIQCPNPFPVVHYRGPRYAGGGRLPKLLAADIQPYLLDRSSRLRAADSLTFHSHCLISVNASLLTDSNLVCADIPLRVLAARLSKAQLDSIARRHKCQVKSRSSAEELRTLLENHICKCDRHMTVFKIQRADDVSAKESARRKANREKEPNMRTPQSEALRNTRKQTASTGTGTVNNSTGACSSQIPFPPAPASEALQHTILTGMCGEFEPSKFQDVGCTVCGQLVPASEATPKDDVMLDWNVLCREGVTREPRLSMRDNIDECKGPVLDAACTHVCVKCESSLRRHNVPTHALANHLWIGAVPWQLRDLKFAEQMLIARVRHNRCVVRVASGRGKMMANAIMFQSPIVQVYHQLPLSKDALSQVLAFVFLGSAKPTEEDFARTPMLVRRARVKAALDWLKLNHNDYEHLDISEENLKALPEAGIFCGVDWKETGIDDPILEAEGLSQHDTGEHREGTSSGPCPFVVSGLTGHQYDKASLKTLKAAALEHLKTGKKSLGVGHAKTPESTYDNLQLYPQMFPWLFPYGKGGIKHPEHKRRISAEAHKRLLLMYHDKRFQNDFYFPMVAFNEAQIKRASTGSHLLVESKNLSKITSKLQALNGEVLSNLARRLESGEHIKVKTPDEQACFDILNELEHVGSHVQGSLASKKHQRNEVWSVVSFKGAPTWFITYAPSDTLHPLSLYFADTKLDFSPQLRSSEERLKLVAQNPVAAARFFHYVTQAFIKHVLGVGTDHPGLYGETDAYHGTVEQQGRLTLHMHMLIWIKSALSPLEIRVKMLDPDGEFQKAMIAYIEACQVGQFLTGTMSEVRAKVPLPKRSRGLHEIDDPAEAVIVPPGYQDPTQTLPDMPPPLCKVDCQERQCSTCNTSQRWWVRYSEIVDDLFLRTNVHRCIRPSEGTDLSKPIPANAKIKIPVSGCLRKDGSCSARFPRDIHPETEVDPADGSISVKKLEPMINTMSPLLTYSLRCNTDVTSLLSGTAIKAVIAYICDYVTKPSLKIYHAFDAVHAVLYKHTLGINSTGVTEGSSRRLVAQMVNSLTSKMQIGSPMASMYLLGYPDHYTNLQFKTCWWKSYVSVVQRAWPEASPLRPVEHVQDGILEDEAEDETQRTVLMQGSKAIVGATAVDDYIYRPCEYEHCNVYEWIQVHTRCKRTRVQLTEFEASLDPGRVAIEEMAQDIDDWLEDDLPEGAGREAPDECASYAFKEGHPLWRTHYAKCDRRFIDITVPNFIGGSLPRRDQGDREVYCRTMLALFKPWRDGRDLKAADETWNDAFTKYCFSKKDERTMSNFNLRYECNDARDDFSAQDRTNKPSFSLLTALEQHEDAARADDYANEGETDYGALLKVLASQKGPRQAAKDAQMLELENVLSRTGWVAQLSTRVPSVRKTIGTRLGGKQWKSRQKFLRNELFAAKFRNAPISLKTTKPFATGAHIEGVTLLPAAYFTKEFVAKQTEASAQVADTIAAFCLNVEQERAFRIVANHSLDAEAQPLRMYLGGVGGTGKSQVIKALIHFFETRGESHRFIVLGPSGTAAALLGGSTYHSVLGIREQSDEDKPQGTSIKQIQERLRGVEYVFLDEVSMVSCQALYAISSKLALALGESNEPFGGMNMIFAGDFGQLPPVNATASFSGNHEPDPSRRARQRASDQKSAIGKILWQQVTTVVILKQNMRQKTESTEDTKFRTALVNMRFAACTREDIRYLESRTIGTASGRPKFTDRALHNISIITALNAHKDKINELGSERFARETEQELTEFFSEDSLGTNADGDKRRPQEAKRKRAVVITREIPKPIQDILWNAYPSTTSRNIAGKLRLCIGLPVMIRHNEATELSITKGQEAKVVGWQTDVGSRKQNILDSLFVELIDPPKPVQVPGLPTNVVVLTMRKEKVWCNLPDDSTIHITRSQVPVLPNFAMTDYSSQGKTRPINVVDLNNCPTHFSYYTALSRGTSSAGTIILQGADWSKVTKGISGYLRQEFRELEVLNEITWLRYEGKLPPSVSGGNRRELLIAFHAARKVPFELTDVHPALRSKVNEGAIHALPVLTGKWELIGDEKKAKKNLHIEKDTTKGASNKQPRSDLEPDNPSKKPKRDEPEPIGITWDAENWSCAFDALVTCLFDVWDEFRPMWTERLSSMGMLCAKLVDGFEAVHSGTMTLNGARDAIRSLLFELEPEHFQRGKSLTVLDRLSHAMFGAKSWGSTRTKCVQCSATNINSDDVNSSMSMTYDAELVTKFKSNYGVAHWLAARRALVGDYKCRSCGGATMARTVVQTAPPLLFVQLPSTAVRIDERAAVRVNNEDVTYLLRGVVYLGGRHFTSRLIRRTGQCWYHDGQSTGHQLDDQGKLCDKSGNFLWRCDVGSVDRQAVGALYAREDD